MAKRRAQETIDMPYGVFIKSKHSKRYNIQYVRGRKSEAQAIAKRARKLRDAKKGVYAIAERVVVRKVGKNYKPRRR